jgi:hypothetical protein
MHADGAENCTEDRSGTAVPVLAVLHLPGASLDVGCAIVVRLHLLDEGVELALDTTEAAQYVGDGARSWLQILGGAHFRKKA